MSLCRRPVTKTAARLVVTVMNGLFQSPAPDPTVPESVTPRIVPNDIAEAARALARLRIKKARNHASETRKWTGKVFGRRAPVGLAVVLDGEVCHLKSAERGRACVKTSRTDPEYGPVHEYCQVTSLRPYKLPEAVLVGRRKAGVTEIKSARKAAACRKNASLPRKPGKRAQGRSRSEPAPNTELSKTAGVHPAKARRMPRSKDIFAGYRRLLRKMVKSSAEA